MKKFIILVGAVILGVSSLTIQASEPNSFAQTLGSAWKSPKSSMDPTKERNDLTIVYGGQDVSLRPTMIDPSAAA